MEKNDLSMIKAENERLVSDIDKLKARLREEVARTQAGVRLDLNLEKGRIREEASRQELKMKEVDTRIEQEIAGLRAAIQSSKATTLQYIVGFGEPLLVCARLTSRLQVQSLVALRCSWRTCASEFNITIHFTVHIYRPMLMLYSIILISRTLSVVERREDVAFDLFAESYGLKLGVCAVEVVVDDDEVMRVGLLGVCDLEQGGVEALLDGLGRVGTATLEASAEGGDGRRRDEEEDWIEVRLLDLADALDFDVEDAAPALGGDRLYGLYARAVKVA